MSDANVVFVIDDDEAVRDALSMLLEAAGYTAAVFQTAAEFLDVCTPATLGCIILDVDMPGMDGPALQQELLRRKVPLPVIFLSGKGTIPVTVRTIKTGAIDFLTKPVDRTVLLDCVQKALTQGEEIQSIALRLAALTEREHEVMKLAVAGHTNKEIGQRLGISYRTVEIHRTHVMHKTGATNLLELARIADAFEAHRIP
ncbi:MAG TPA: response regulator [Gallionella sp.]|nr:response regulator [Gallionella sp.]HUW76284.1 response regulator [Gallionella sp.]